MPNWSKLLTRHKLTAAALPFNRVKLRNGQTTYVRGLTASIKKTFCPKFTKPKTRGTSSKKIGLRVHAQLEAWACGNPPKRMHSYAKAIVKYLEEKKVEVVGAETPLVSVKGKFFTRSDLIVKGKKGLRVISFKTGGNQAFKRGKHVCRLIPSQKDSIYVQHQLQLALECQCLEADYGIPVEGGLVIYAGFGSKKKLRVEPLAPWTKHLDLLQLIRTSSKEPDLDI